MSNGTPQWSESDLSEFNDSDTDQAKIGREVWVPCRICWGIFERVRLTARYCNNCGRGFCEGEHGSFAGGRVAMCVRCYSRTGSGLA